MSIYTLSINIHSECKELLDNLMITLESIKGDVSDLTSVELVKINGPVCLDYRKAEKPSPFTVTQRNLFLDGWSINDAS